MTKLLPFLLLAPAVFAETKPAAAPECATPVVAPAKPAEETAAETKARIKAATRARFDKEKADNARDIAVVHAEKIDLAKLLEGRLTDAEGKPVAAETVLKARHVAFYHSASWCCGCKIFTPKLLEAAKKYAPSEVAIVFVSWDKPGKATQDYMHKSGMPWPSVTRGTFKDSPARLAINCIPHLRVYETASGRMVADSIKENGEFVSQADQLVALDKRLGTPAAAK